VTSYRLFNERILVGLPPGTRDESVILRTENVPGSTQPPTQYSGHILREIKQPGVKLNIRLHLMQRLNFFHAFLCLFDEHIDRFTL